MDRCSTELVTRIIESACAGESGQTARRVGLVSKYFRTIAEPIEFREIEISGLEQLEGTLKRLNTVDRPGEMLIEVRHLFISKLKREHALAAEAFFSNGTEYWGTEEGKQWLEVYNSRTIEFWTLASTIIAKTSPTLRTLFLLASNHWLVLVPMGQIMCSKALGALSGVNFPCLASLAVYHNGVFEESIFEHDFKEFLAPTTPSLGKLLIISPVWDMFLHTPLHPLLCSVLQSADSELSLPAELFGVRPNSGLAPTPDIGGLVDLSVCCDGPEDAEILMGLIFGENWRVEPRMRTLPGKVRSLKLQQEARELSALDALAEEEALAQAQNFVAAVEGLHIDGLVACSPVPRFSEGGQCRYEQSLTEWKEQCLESH